MGLVVYCGFLRIKRVGRGCSLKIGVEDLVLGSSTNSKLCSPVLALYSSKSRI